MNDKVKSYLVFDKLITPIVIQVLFWISVVLCVLGGLYTWFVVHDFWMGLASIILGPLVSRVSCELVILTFKFYDAIVALKK